MTTLSRSMLPTPPTRWYAGSLRRQVSLLLALACCGALGCATTATLKPTLVARDCTSDDDAATLACGTPCGLATMGTACAAEPANSIKSYAAPTPPLFVGWYDRYDDGTDPCPCWEWVSTFSRGYVKFEPLFVNLDRITYASLSWSRTQKEGKTESSCAKYLYEATGPWVRGKTPRALVYGDLDVKGKSGGFVGLADLVTKWAKSPQDNFGLIFVPVRESTKGESNSKCVDQLDDLTLVVKYKTKNPPWPK